MYDFFDYQAEIDRLVELNDHYKRLLGRAERLLREIDKISLPFALNLERTELILEIAR
jgi:hypothetical protein